MTKTQRSSDETPVTSGRASRRGSLRGLRWYVCGLLFLVTAINYIDRVSLGALNDEILKPAIGWDDAGFAWILFAFHVAYALMCGFAGRLLDRLGVRTGLALGVIVWSLAAMGHALASTILGFAIARFVLGLGEATNFPAAIKALAEWFPQRQRSLATGIFNTGTNVGAMLQGPIASLAILLGWQSAFVLFGALGLVWLVGWLRFYRPPEEHPRLGADEAALIRSGQEAPVARLDIPWPCLLRYREAWAFCLGKMFTDPVWWFYLYWLPSYLRREQHVDLKGAAWSLVVIYLAADAGSFLGGWIPGRLQRWGWPASKARLRTMLACASLMPAALLVGHAGSLTTVVALISVATACHQGWSANMFTVASDAFPKQAVGSVVGFGAMCGAIGGMFMPLVAGAILQWRGNFAPLFIVAGVVHPLSWLAIRLLTGKTIRLVDLERGLRTGFSPALLAGGIVLTVVGCGGAVVAWWGWAAIVAATEGSTATAAMGVAGSVMLALLGLALAYASRGQRNTAPAGS